MPCLAFCPNCGIHAIIIDGDRTLLDLHIKRTHRRR